MTDTLFENTQTNKYDSWDVEALKKKALAADSHIATLESELSTIRSEKTTDVKMEELLSKLDQLSQPSFHAPASTVVNQTLESKSETKVNKPDDIVATVTNIIEQKQKEAQIKANVEKVQKELKSVWGDNYRATMTNKAQELGVSQDFLASMAETHPDAFLKLVLDKPKLSNPNSHVPPSSVVNTKVGSIQIGESYKDFKKAMKDNPSLISDPAFNARMHEAAQRLGKDFYN